MKRNKHQSVATLAVGFAVLVLATAACTASAPSPTPGPVGSSAPVASSPPPAATASPSPAASVAGFVFAANDIVAYYQALGYKCAAEQPSATAAGFFVRTCSLLDPAGRTREIGVVTDPTGRVANGFASVTGTSSETILDPTVVLEPLSAFLGALLGEEQGAALVPWLAGHLGDAYAQTTLGPITIATYTDAPDLHAKLYLELGNQEYLTAPGTSAP